MQDSTAFIFFKIQDEQSLRLAVCVDDVMHIAIAAEFGDMQAQAPPTPSAQ